MARRQWCIRPAFKTVADSLRPFRLAARQRVSPVAFFHGCGLVIERHADAFGVKCGRVKLRHEMQGDSYHDSDE